MTQNSLTLRDAEALLQQRRYGEADQLLRRLADHGPAETRADAQSLLGQLCLQSGRRDEAEGFFRQALTGGENSARLNDLAVALAMRGAEADARQLWTRAISLAPEDPGPRCNLGRMLFAAGERDAALKELQAAVRCDARYAPGWLYYGMILLESGAAKAAQDALCHATELMPGHPVAWCALGDARQKLADPAGAEQAFQKALQLQPDAPQALERLGHLSLDQQKPELALKYFRRLLELQPGSPIAHNGCGVALVRLNAMDAALKYFRAVLAADPHFPGAAINLAGTLNILGRSAEALTAYEVACQVSPKDPRAEIGRADILRTLGRMAEAHAAYQRALTLAPKSPVCYRRMLALGPEWPLRAGEAQALRDLEADAAGFSLSDQAELHFALYRLEELSGAPPKAIRHLFAANAARRRQVPYQEAAELQALSDIVKATPAELFSAGTATGASSDLPVFIVGMPRSGTTLVEQILASHPDVFGAGEIPDFADLVGAGFTHAPDVVLADLSDADMRRLGQRYIEGLRARAPSAKRIVDKLPWNYRLIGHIHKLLPGATILHIRRDPMDTCFSCFAQNFRDGVSFSYDLAELGRYYRAYEQVMAHWRTVLPPDAFSDISYDALVTDFEPQVRRLLEICGLGWNPACLSFYRTERAVQTTSAPQVRRPLYRSSVGRWKPYAEALAPLRAALAGV